MSVKQFISAEEHLAKLGVTVQQAYDFIFANVDQPEKIFDAAFDAAVTTNMLSEITNISTNIICNYFDSAGFDCGELDDTSILVNTDLGSFEKLIAFNNNTDSLSTHVLRESTQSKLEFPSLIEIFFEPIFGFQRKDGIYDAEELGVGHLDNVPATNESIESLFYGSLINFFSELNPNELEQINSFNGNQDEYHRLLFDVLSETSPTGSWTNDELSNLVVNEATNIINEHPPLNGQPIGLLDSPFSFHLLA